MGQFNPFTDGTHVYFSDYFGTLLFRYTVATKKMDIFTVAGISDPAFFIPVAHQANTYLIGWNGTVAVVNWDGSSSTGSINRILFNVQPNQMIGDAHTTKYGELYVGVHAPNYCAGPANLPIYRYTRARGLETVVNNMAATAGTVIIGNTVYVLDGCTNVLWSYAYNPTNGAWSK